MEEIAEAVKEVAKTTGQAIKTVDRLGQFFSRVMGESIDATCGMLADTLKYRRWERQIQLIEKAERLIIVKKLSNNSIPISPKLALPIFQNASLEEDDLLHDLYAKLLVTAIDPEIQTRRTAFAEVIRQLEPLDVKILQAMHIVYKETQKVYHEKPNSNKWHKGQRPPTWAPISKGEILHNITISESDYWESIDNLSRLGLADFYFGYDSSDTTNVYALYGQYDTLCITALGLAFVEICNYR